MLIKNLNEKYNPLYFLASLGAGGLAVSFFMYPNFMLPHVGSPMITFDQIYPILTGDNTLTAILLASALLAIILLSILHFRLLFWNISEYRKFKNTNEFQSLMTSNREVSLMVIPLTLAMSVNVSFILGAVFVPGLWSVVEYLFPFALLAFLAIGIYAFKILGTYLTRIISSGDFSFSQNNNFSQLMAVFALTMVAVGFAAPGAMSHHQEVNAIGIFFSLLFLSAAIVLGIILLAMGFKSILEHGIEKGTSVSIWIMIPILTLIGITVIRITMGLHHGFETELSTPSFFIFTSVILTLQILVGLIGYKVMNKIGYFRDHSKGTEANAGSFALICPGVAFFVFGMFFISFGLVQNGLVTIMSPMYLVLLSALVLVQIQTLRVFFRLLCKVVSFGPCKVSVPA